MFVTHATNWFLWSLVLSSEQPLIHDGCVKDKTEDCQNSSVLYCIHTYEQFSQIKFRLIGFSHLLLNRFRFFALGLVLLMSSYILCAF